MSTSAAAPAAESTSYDRTPYPSSSFPQSHPNRIGAIGRLFGLNTARPSEARVLELGCADGSNLLPMAEMLLGARFIGLDASRVQIEAGRKIAARLGLQNLELRHQNILDFAPGEGKFDYIIVHGIFSWVPEVVREKILQICEDHLADHGVAYVSYNALPGWNMRRSLRDMMLFHTRGFADPAMKIQQARALIRFLADSVETEMSAYSLLLQNELQNMANTDDNYLLHDILGDENTPVYFHEFIARATRHKLQYVGEPGIAQMLAGNFPDKVKDTLGKLGNNIIAQEQYMDFLRNRTFRQTILCRVGTPIRRNLVPEDMKGFSFQPLFKPQTAPFDLSPGVAVAITGTGGATVGASDPFLKAVFQLFAESGNRIIEFSDLLARARALSRPFVGELPPNRDAVEEATLASNLLSLLVKGFLDLSIEPVAMTTTGAELDKPAFSALARYQSMTARLITNRVHQPIQVDAMGRYLMVAADGTRTRAGLLDELVARVTEGKLAVAEDGKAVADLERVRTLLAPRIDPMVRVLAQHGFLAP